ncbi:hypothetical protein DFH11DRAFT_1517256, partial [Phellopilus nigrolimitatus]
AETLARHGYIATAPNHPSLAFSTRALKYFRVLNSRCASLSIQAFVRSLCDLHKEPYNRSMRRAFSSAYDVYIEIVHTINNRLDELLHKTTISKYQDTCPACVYRVAGEPHLKFSMLTCMDGNESMKRVRRTRTLDEDVTVCVERPDGRGRGSHMFLEADEVDIFEDEVTQARAARAQERTRQKTHSTASDLQSTNDKPSPCVPRWKNMSDDSKKKMWGIFDETGIFITACRHGTVLQICDMIQSGELWKYPLAMVARLTDVFGKDIMSASDVGCEFSTTANSAPLVGPKVRANNLNFCVNAFHGYAHCRLCQLRWHPLYTKGVGLEDFETCERVFSESNRVATCTRHASKFHRRQSLLLHFARWNADKKAESSRFILNNYRQALRNIHSLSSELNAAMASLKIEGPEIFEQWHAEEYEYLQSLQEPRDADVLAMGYVKSLKNLSAANTKSRWMNTSADAIRTTYNYSQATSSTRSIETARRKGLHTVVTYQREVEDYETKLGVLQRWTEDSEEWKAADITIAEFEYRQALDHLEGLVVARLFELAKTNREGTCCSLRTQISKNLKSRSLAIRNAVSQYNSAAAALTPAREPLEVKIVLDYVFLGEFDLLRDSRHDIREKRWVRSAERESAIAYYKLERSREEILRLNVEIMRLMAYIIDNEKRLADTVTVLEETDPALAHQLKKRVKIETALNRIHRQRIYDIATLDGFTGDVQGATAFCTAEDSTAQEGDDLEDTIGNGNDIDDHVEAAFQVLSLAD